MKPRFPILSLVSLVLPFLVGLGSYPLWLRTFANQDPTGDAGIFIVIAAINGAILAAGLGGIIGAVMACFAHRRRERFAFIRAISFLGNLGFAGYGIYLLLSLPRA
jgi:ABC-type Fe3+ transport system permease subunit